MAPLYLKGYKSVNCISEFTEEISWLYWAYFMVAPINYVNVNLSWFIEGFGTRMGEILVIRKH